MRWDGMGWDGMGRHMPNQTNERKGAKQSKAKQSGLAWSKQDTYIHKVGLQQLSTWYSMVIGSSYLALTVFLLVPKCFLWICCIVMPTGGSRGV